MNYELAKQLKEAGYPQFTRREPLSMTGNMLDGQTEHVAIPSLSELIEACGDKFESLIRRKEWEAWGNYYCCDGHGQSMKILEGSTPEEAVANLWLALHAKQ